VETNQPPQDLFISIYQYLFVLLLFMSSYKISVPGVSLCIMSFPCGFGVGIILDETRKKHPGDIPPTVPDQPSTPHNWNKNKRSKQTVAAVLCVLCCWSWSEYTGSDANRRREKSMKPVVTYSPLRSSVTDNHQVDNSLGYDFNHAGLIQRRIRSKCKLAVSAWFAKL